MRIKCLAQKHNTMSPARARIWTARSGAERTNHEATAIEFEITFFQIILIWKIGNNNARKVHSTHPLMSFMFGDLR